jgi:putative transposase
MAEAFNSLFKAELVRNRGPWRGLEDLEIATVGYIDWYNNRRLHGELGHITPAEHEALHAVADSVTASLETSQPALHQTRGLTVAASSMAWTDSTTRDVKGSWTVRVVECNVITSSDGALAGRPVTRAVVVFWSCGRWRSVRPRER